MRFIVPDLSDPNKYPRAVRKAVGHQAEAERQAAREHRERIRPLLPPSLQELMDLNIHDGIIRELIIDPEQKTMELRLIVGDLITGYFDAHLMYQDIELTPLETSLLCLVAHEKSAEISHHEIDMEEGAESPLFIHRILWNTMILTSKPDFILNEHILLPEIELRFGRFEIESMPRPTRGIPLTETKIAIIRDPDETKAMPFLQNLQTNSSGSSPKSSGSG